MVSPFVLHAAHKESVTRVWQLFRAFLLCMWIIRREYDHDDRSMLQERIMVPVPRAPLWCNAQFCRLFMLIAFCAWACWPLHAQAALRAVPASISAHELHAPRASGAADLHATEPLTATLAVNTRAAVVGGTLVYTLTLANNSAAPEPFHVTDTLPDSLMLIGAPGMSFSEQTLTAEGTIDSGAQRQFTITARVHVYRSMVENAATVRFGGQMQTIAAPAVRIASAASSSTYYLPLLMR
jgi:uncharacterized repeat protein (TIGR01451 family)